MSDTPVLGKMLLFIGLLMVFVVAIAPGSNTAWTGLQNTLATGLTLPTFDNPFDSILSMKFEPTADGAYHPTNVTNPGGVPGCTGHNVDWWGCVAINDGTSSFLSINYSHQAFATNYTVNLGGAGAYLVSSIVFDFACRSLSASSYTVSFLLSVDGSGVVFTTSSQTCKSGDFQNYSYRNDFSSVVTVGQFTGSYGTDITINAADPSGQAPLDFSYVSFTINYKHQQSCGTGLDGIGCALQNFVQTVVDGVQFFVNGIVFILVSVGTLSFFILSVIVGFLLGLITTMAWFLNIPGTPVFVQGIIDAIFLSTIGMVIYIIVKTVRGSGPV